MNDEVPWFVSLFISWLPFLMLIALGIWMTLTLRAALHTQDGRSLAQAADDYARELRRANELFEDWVKRRPDARDRRF